MNESHQRNSPPRSTFSKHYDDQQDIDDIERLKSEIKLRK